MVHELVEENLNRRELEKLHKEIDEIYALGPSRIRHSHHYFLHEGSEVTKFKSCRM